MAEEAKQPTVGRIVHYKLAEGVIRPAIIVEVWSPECVSLQVFIDGTNDRQYFEGGEGGTQYSVLPSALWRTSVNKNKAADGEDTFDIGSWDWPTRN